MLKIQLEVLSEMLSKIINPIMNNESNSHYHLAFQTFCVLTATVNHRVFDTQIKIFVLKKRATKKKE